MNAGAPWPSLVDFEPCSYGFRPGRRAHDAIPTPVEHDEE
jgi:hypothetical protein